MDPELLQRARARDPEAFELIVLAKAEPLLRTARAILGNEADARDAVQETLISAWRRLPELRQLDRFDAWIGRTLINECRDGLRRRRRVQELPLADWPARATAGSSPELQEAFGRLSVATGSKSSATGWECPRARSSGGSAARHALRTELEAR